MKKWEYIEKFYEIAEGQDFPLILHSKQLEILLRSFISPSSDSLFPKSLFSFLLFPCKTPEQAASYIFQLMPSP